MNIQVKQETNYNYIKHLIDLIKGEYGNDVYTIFDTIASYDFYDDNYVVIRVCIFIDDDCLTIDKLYILTNNCDETYDGIKVVYERTME